MFNQRKKVAASWIHSWCDKLLLSPSFVVLEGNKLLRPTIAIINALKKFGRLANFRLPQNLNFMFLKKCKNKNQSFALPVHIRKFPTFESALIIA